MIITVVAGTEQDQNVQKIVILAEQLGVQPVIQMQQGTNSKIAQVHLRDGALMAKSLRESQFRGLSGVIAVTRVSLAKVDVFAQRPTPHFIRLSPNVTIGAGQPCLLILGTCTTDPTIARSIQALDQLGVRAVRSGPFKPRSSSGSFCGNGEKGIRWYLEAVQVASNVEVAFMEVMEPAHITLVARIADEICFTKKIVLWVGAHTESTNLLVALGRQTRFPVMLKNGKNDQTVDELKRRADWILEPPPDFDEFGRPSAANNAVSVNENLMFCLRGTAAVQPSQWRNTPNWHWADTLRSRGAWAPVIIDSSHAAGHIQYLDRSLASALLYNPDGLIIETGYPRDGWKGVRGVPEGFRGACDVSQSLPLEDVPALIARVSKHNAVRGTAN